VSSVGWWRKSIWNMEWRKHSRSASFRQYEQDYPRLSYASLPGSGGRTHGGSRSSATAPCRGSRRGRRSWSETQSSWINLLLSVITLSFSLTNYSRSHKYLLSLLSISLSLLQSTFLFFSYHKIVPSTRTRVSGMR